MGKEETHEMGNLRPVYRDYEQQKCFVGHTYNASWNKVIVEVCNEVLPTFNLRPWYADTNFDPTTPLREKVVEMIANTRYGIYDLSYWRCTEQSGWEMPRNVLIELGMAIALNRPILLLRHAANRIAGLALPNCLQSMEATFCEFTGGKKSLKEALNTYLPQWIQRSSEQEWRNRYCHFGGLVCDYRGSHPQAPLVIQKTIACHIADGHDIDQDDFRDSVEAIMERYETISYHYLDACSRLHSYNFLLCSHCQLVRSTPFAIYRLTSRTPAETFIAIGISIALEAQFGYKIPKILLTEKLDDVPSLLTGYEVVVARNDQELRARLTQFLPQVIQRVQVTTWKPQALPFEVSLPEKDFQHLEQREGVKDEGDSSQTHEPTSLHDITLICSPDGQDWVSWIGWVLEVAGHSVTIKMITKTGILDEAIMIAVEKAESTLFVISSTMLDILNRAKIQNIPLIRNKLTGVQIHSGRVRLRQKDVAVMFDIVDFTTSNEQNAIATLLSYVSNESRQGQSSLVEQLSRMTPQEEEPRKPSFPGAQAHKGGEDIKLFYCYAHEDEKLRNEFDKHLYNLRRQGLIAECYARDISAGMEWKHEIDVHVNTAQIILLLISPDFMASEYCYSIEMMRIMERHEAVEVYVIPIILKPIDWQDAPFSKLQMLPRNAKAVTRQRDRSEAFIEIAKSIREVIKNMINNIE